MASLNDGVPASSTVMGLRLATHWVRGWVSRGDNAEQDNSGGGSL
jgi:hypothetical protein